METPRRKNIRYGSLALVLVIVALSVILTLLLRSAGRLQTGALLPRITPTPSPTDEPVPTSLSVTSAPTPVAVKIQRQYPPRAVDVMADGKLLFTAQNAESARIALERYLAENASVGLKDNEQLVRAAFDQKLVLLHPSGEGTLLNVEEAVNTLNTDNTLLPISRTIVRCEVERTDAARTERDNPLLPEGSRYIPALGSPAYTLSYYETVYRGEAAYSETKTNEFTLGQGQADRIVEKGTYPMESASPSAGPAALAIPGFSPVWPVTAPVATSFGWLNDAMHYGVDFELTRDMQVTAPEGGVIIYCGRRGDLGLVIDILHDETGCISRISGLSRIQVELYQRVRKKEPLGQVYPAGSAPLRYELLVNGLAVNPEKYLPRRDKRN